MILGVSNNYAMQIFKKLIVISSWFKWLIKVLLNEHIELSLTKSFLLSENWISIESKAKMSKTKFLNKANHHFHTYFLKNNDRETQ